MSDQFPPAPAGPQLRTIAVPANANEGGRVATIAIEAMHFLRTVAVGDEVACYRTLEKTGETSVVVKVETWARGRGRGKAPEKVTEDVFTFVVIDDEGRPRALPEASEA